MSQKPLNRTSLKSLFSNGKRPNESNFGSLIDSMLNKADDGISKNFKDGLTLSPEGENSNRLISFKEKIQDHLPKWGLELKRKEDTQGLGFIEPLSDTENQTHLFIKKGGNVGIGTTAPKTTLEVNGTMSANSRIGTYKLSTVPADGKWHTILANLDGCNAFELIAQVGKKKKGRYALLHAHALSTFGKSHSRIRRTQAYYGWWWNRLSIRWSGTTHNYRLQIRTRSDYGSEVIKFHIIKLWDNDIEALFNPQ